MTEFNKYFKENKIDEELNTFSFKNFEVHEFSSRSYSSLNKSCIGRITNELIVALNENNTLPKLIVVIVDNDFLRDMKDPIYYNIKRISSWLITQFERNIAAYKDYLPIRLKKTHIPHVLWIQPPEHKDFEGRTMKLEANFQQH